MVKSGLSTLQAIPRVVCLYRTKISRQERRKTVLGITTGLSNNGARCGLFQLLNHIQILTDSSLIIYGKYMCKNLEKTTVNININDKGWIIAHVVPNNDCLYRALMSRRAIFIRSS